MSEELFIDSVPNHISIGMNHLGEYDTDDWKESNFNYRLNICDTKLFLVLNNIVVGHLGINEETVRCIFVEEEHRGKGYGFRLYEYAFEHFNLLYSDDAREEQDTKIWQKLKEKYPNNISYDRIRNQFIWNKVIY